MEDPLIGILITLLFSAFFSGMEIAFISSNRLKIELDKVRGTFNSKILSIFYQKESHFIAMLLLGNNIALVFFGLFSAELLEGYIHNWGITSEGAVLLIQTIISTGLVLVIAEFLPKTFVQMNPNLHLKYVVVPTLIIYILLYIPTLIILFLSNTILKLLNVQTETTEKVFSKVDLEDYVQDITERIEEEDYANQVQILQNALDFDSVQARDCMIPRTQIISIEIEDDVNKLRHLFIETGKSKIIVYRENIDNIIGYVHSFEMFKNPETIKQILLPINFIPEANPGKEILEYFTNKSSNIAVVVDEYGGTAGVVTIEDVIEEIFGEIEDEHDNENVINPQISETEYKFPAHTDIDHIIEEYGLNLPEDEAYETLGGMLLNHLASIPSAGTELTIDNIRYTIEEVSENKIETVRLNILN